MAFHQVARETYSVMEGVHVALLSFPVACFTLTVLTDLAYVASANLQWLHFSEWLLLAGLVAGAAELLVSLVEFLLRRVRPSWLAVAGGVVVMLLATLNSFVHTIDGWQAVMPNGLILSIATVAAMLITAWLGRAGRYHA